MISKLDSYIENHLKLSIYNTAFGFARTVFAISTLLTLLCNDEHVMFKSGINHSLSPSIALINKFNIFWLVPDQHITLLKWGLCVLLCIIASGWRPRFTCILHWYIATCFFNASLDIEGGDQIISNITLLLIPICLLDNRKSHWDVYLPSSTTFQSVSRIITNSFFFLIKIQVCVLYFHSAIGKFAIPQWINGTALYYWFNHPVFGMTDSVKNIVNPVVTNSFASFILCWSVLIFELILSAGILISKKYYKKLFILGVGFHFMIIIAHGLFSFFFSMLAVLLLYFMVEYENYKNNKNKKSYL